MYASLILSGKYNTGPYSVQTLQTLQTLQERGYEPVIVHDKSLVFTFTLLSFCCGSLVIRLL